jgi:hypothetical protein
VHADSEVVHHAQRHPGAERDPLRGGELVVEDPLEPAVEVHPLGELGARLLDLG